MDRAVARLNIEHYRRLLAGELEESKRRTLRQLLAEEEQKLATLGDGVPDEKKRL